MFMQPIQLIMCRYNMFNCKWAVCRLTDMAGCLQAVYSTARRPLSWGHVVQEYTDRIQVRMQGRWSLCTPVHTNTENRLIHVCQLKHSTVLSVKLMYHWIGHTLLNLAFRWYVVGFSLKLQVVSLNPPLSTKWINLSRRWDLLPVNSSKN
jgi:hypothetical protein